MSTIKISVIVPVYNAGESLHGCVRSLLDQTLRDIELIFVLDCPTDGSDRVIEDYAKIASNIVIIRNQTNKNIGESRNIGLNAAEGEFVAFCDHDDIVEPFMYEEMYKLAMKENADICLGVPRYCYEDLSLNKTFYYPECLNIKKKLLPLLIGRDRSDSSDWNFYFSHGVIWDNIYKKDLIDENSIRFVDNNKCTFEDNLFLINILIHSKNPVVYNKHCYNHMITGSNTSSKSTYTRYPLILNYIQSLYNTLNSNDMYDKYKVRFSNSVVMYITGAFVCEIKKYKYRLFKIIISYLHIKKTPIVRNAFRNCTIKPYSNNEINNLMLLFINIIFKI